MLDLSPERRFFGVRGITLIETLISAAIIVIVVALLFPRAQMLKRSGQQTQCVSNLRQIAAAYNLYASENRGYLPATKDPIPGSNPPSLGRSLSCGAWFNADGNGDGVSTSSVAALLPAKYGGQGYLDNVDVLYCPNEAINKKRKKGELFPNRIGYNWLYIPQVNETGANPVPSDWYNDKVSGKQDLVVLFDVLDFTGAWVSPHEKLINGVYLDGSVRSLPLSSLMDSRGSLLDVWNGFADLR